LAPLLEGIKTIESRFSRARRAPYGVLSPGDIVAVKRPGGPVVAAFQTDPVPHVPRVPNCVPVPRSVNAAVGVDHFMVGFGRAPVARQTFLS
jgi:hypothetical protein